MARLKHLMAFLFVSTLMLGLTGCPHQHRDRYPPPPDQRDHSHDHDHDHDRDDHPHEDNSR